ncbi:MAG: hypothetical protein RLZZ272_1743, partial [Actinomycetota bacterium]
MGPALRLRFEPDALAPSSGTFLAWAEGTDGTADDPGLLGAELARFRLPRGRPAQVVLGPVDGGRAMTVVDARRLPLLPTVRGLAALPPGEDLAPVERPGPEVLAWSVAAKLAIEHVAAGRLVPRVLAAEGPDLAHASWRVVAPGDARADRIEAALLEAAGSSPIIGSDGAVVGRPAVRGFLDAVADVCARGGREVDPRPRGAVRPGPRSMVLLEALTGADARVIVPRDAAPMLADEVALWSSPLDDPDRDVGVGLALRLEERPGGVSTADRAEEWRLALALRDRGSDRTVDAATVWSGAVIDLGRGPLTDPVAVLLRRVAAAARLSTVVDRALEVARPSEVPVDADALVGFLDQERIALEAAGVVVSLPPQLRDVVDRPLRLRLRVGGEVDVPRLPGDDGLSLRSLAAARWELVLGGEVLDAAEAERLSAGAPRLVRWRGRWVRIDPSEIERLRGLAARSPQLGLTEALAAALAREHHDDELGWLEVAVDDSIVDLVERVRVQPGPDQAVTDRLEGELRAYQARGVAWLQRMAELGLGAVLADQMGLGKTIQAIALLASRTGDRPHLVVAPTSVIGNWERELARFAPSLPVVRHHGDERASGVDAFRPGTVVVTTYALLRRDASLLTAVPWDVVVLDEAQQVKNPASLGARAARSLEARMRLAMTGTPVENRLQELWAIIDLTNPGLLGPRRVFERRFAAPIERWHDAEAADRLRRLIAPFVLRRRKTDEDVALDL